MDIYGSDVTERLRCLVPEPIRSLMAMRNCPTWARTFQESARVNRWRPPAVDDRLTRLLYKVDLDVHIGLPGGIKPEDIPLHRGTELEMPMDEMKRVDVAEHRAEQR